MKTEKIITPRTTGYACLASFSCTTLSGISKNKTLRKFHKASAYASIALTALHVGITEYYYNKYKKL